MQESEDVYKMPNSSLIVLILGLVIILVLALGALLGFLAGLKRELKCLTVFVVILGLLWVIFGGSASLDKNIIFGLSGIVKGSLGVPGELQTWREVSLYFGQNQLGLKEILMEGTKTYSLYMNVVSTIVRGLYLVLGTIIAFVLSGLVRFVSFIVRLIVRACRKDKKVNSEEEQVETVVTIKEEQDEPKQKMIGNKSVTSRCLGTGVGLLKSFLIVVLICAPITGLISIVDTVDDDTVDAIEEITMGTQVEGSMVDWVFDVVHALDDSLFVDMLQSSEDVFGKSISLSIFDSAFRVETEDGVIYVREELVKLIDIVDIVAPTYDATKPIPFDIWSLSNEELDALFDALASSELVQSIIPVAFEYAGQMDAIQAWLREAGLMNLNEFVKTVDWENDLVPLLQTVKKALQVVNLNEELDVLNLNSETLRDLINTLGVTTFFQELMPIVVDIALSLAVVENFAGEIKDITGSTITFDWKDELINLVDIYEIIQDLDLDLSTLNLNTLVGLIDDPESFEIIKQAIDKLTSGDLFMEVIVPILDQIVDHQLEVNNFTEFQDLLSLLKMESSDWSHDLPIVLEVLSNLNEIGLLSNQVKLNEYQAMHDIIDSIFDLIILSDKVKVSVEGVDFKTLVVEAAIRQFKIFDLEGSVFEELALREDINWEKERINIHSLIDAFEAFSTTVKDVQGIEFDSLAAISQLDFNLLLNSDLFWDNIMDVLDSVVDSKLVMSILPDVFEVYISPIIFSVNGELGEAGLFEGITSENIVAELYNLVYIALDLKEMGIFNPQARQTFKYSLNALAFYPESGFFESEYFTYQPNPNDLALVDIVERIFASAIFKGREDRIFRVLFSLALGVNVSPEELASINYSTVGSISEKQVLVQGINKLRPMLDDPKFSLFRQYEDEEGVIQTVFNIEYFLDVKNLDTILGAINVLTYSKLITYLVPEVYNQLLVPNGVIPAGWADILAVQSTYLGKTDGITAEQLNDDIRSLITIIREVVEFGLADFLIPEKARNIQIFGIGALITDIIDSVIELNIIDGKLDEVIIKLMTDASLEINEEIIREVDWEKELLSLRNIFKYVEELLCLSGLVTYGDVLDFLATVPMDISIFYNTMTMYDVAHICLELYNTQILYEVIYEFVFNKMLAGNTLFNDLINLEKYDVTCFKTDLIILSDLTYHMIYSDFMKIIGCMMFPNIYSRSYAINLANAHNAYILEDVLSLNILNLNLYNIFEFVFETMGFKFSLVDLFGVRLVNELEYGVPGMESFIFDDVSSFTEYNNSIAEEDYSFIGDATKVREMYLALIPFFEGEEFPINTTQDLFGFMNAFMNPETIEAYMASKNLNTYALSVADALDIFADMTIAKFSLVPIIDIIDRMGIAFGGVKLSELMAFDNNWTKTDMLEDIDMLAEIIRNAVGFDLINIMLQDAEIKWTGDVQTASMQDLIRNVFSLNYLSSHFEMIFSSIVATMTASQLQIELASPVTLIADGEKIANAYPYIAAIMNDTIGLKHMSELSTLAINPGSFLVTDAALNAIYAVREIITISILEAVLPGIFEIFDNMGFKQEIRPLFDLSDITAKGLLLAAQDLTYPLEDLVKLNVLDILQKQNISLEGFDALPGIVDRILHNEYVDYKYQAILSLLRLMIGLKDGTIDVTAVHWNDEVAHITGAIQDVVDIINNSGFQTANDLIRLVNEPNTLGEHATVENIEEVVSFIRHLISSMIIEKMGLGVYEQALLPVLQTNLNPVIYNLIKIDNKYTGSELFDDIELILQTVETVIYGDIYNILLNDLEIDYVGITPDVKAILNNILGMAYLNDKIVYVYDYFALMGIDNNYIDFDSFDFVNDATLLGDAYEQIAPLLDTKFNPYQKLSDLAIQGLPFNLAGAKEELFIEAINGLKLVTDATIIKNNIPSIIVALQNSFATIPDSAITPLLQESVDLPLANNEYKNTTQIIHDDINTILDLMIYELEAGIFDMLRDPEGYDINKSIIPAEIEIFKAILNLRYLTELKGQDILEEIFKVLSIDERLDFETLTYNHEITVIENILDYFPDILSQTGCISYVDYMNLYSSFMQGTLDLSKFITQENFTTLIDILDCLIVSEINKQAVIPFYQTHIYPAYESTNNQGIIDLFNIDETIYTNDNYISDYESIVIMLKELDMAGIFGILFNDEEINYDNVDVVETAIRTILESNIFKYKEEFIVPTLVNTYSQFDANLKLIDTEVIKLSQDVDYIVNAYKEIVPVLMNKGFPYKKLSDLSKVATVNLSNFVNDSTAYAIIRTLRELNETSLVEGTIPYLVNMGKLMLNNENINKLLSYKDRGLTNKDIVADLRTLLREGGALETLVDIKILDLINGIDINIYNKEAYEVIIRDVWGLNLLDGQYATVVKYLGNMFGFNFDGINTNTLDEAIDKEVVITLVNDLVELLHNNNFDYIIPISEVMQDPTKWGQYITDNNILSFADMVKDAFGLTVLEEVLPIIVNTFTNTYIVDNYRNLFYIDTNYSYASLKEDYVDHLYVLLYDLAEIGISDILFNNAVIPWDKVKEDGTTYYGSDILSNLVSLQYLDSKKLTIYQIFFEAIFPNINVDAFEINNEADNFSAAYADLVPFLTSKEWVYNTYNDLLGIMTTPIYVYDVLSKDNTQSAIDALREFNDSVMLETVIGPFFESIEGQLAPWIDFSRVVEANEELEEYDRFLNILEILNEMGYTDNDYAIIKADLVIKLIDTIFGNETLATPVKGLTCITDQGECIIMLYNANLIPTLAGVMPNVEGVEEGKWHEEILALRNIIEALGAISTDNTINMATIIEEVLESTDVEKLEDIFVALNESTLYRNVLYRAIYDSISGSLASYITTWFTSQRDNNMNDEWDQEVIILARLLVTINSLGGYEAVDIDNYQNIEKGYETGSAATDDTYELVVNDVNAGLRQLYQLLEASKTFDISSLKVGIETVLGIN